MMDRPPLPDSYGDGTGAPDGADLRVLLFGPGELWIGPFPDGRRTTQPKAFALLARLALSGGADLVRRDVLLALLWPELDATRGRNALSQAMHRLRRDVGTDLLVTRHNEEVGLAPFVRCDVRMFREAVAAERHSAALALYRGPLLDGFHLSNASAFEHWLDVQRSALRHDAVRAALDLADREQEEGRGYEASCWLRRALEIAPEDGVTLRRLVRTLAELGDRAGAVRAYEAVAARLWMELELEPDAGATALIDGLRRVPRAHDPAVRRSILRGRYLTGVPGGWEPALASYRTAIELAPDGVEGHAGLAQCLATLALQGHLSREAAAGPLETAARRAIALDDGIADPHVALGVSRLVFSRDWTGAERAFRHAVSLDTLSASARIHLAFFLANMGAHVEAVQQATLAADLDPLDPLTNFVHGFVLYRARRFEESIAALDALVELHPQHALAHMFIGENELALGRKDAAAASARAAAQLLPDDPLVTGLCCCILGFAGARVEAERMLTRLHELARERYVNPHFLACGHIGIGEVDEAFAHWRALVEKQEPGAFMLRTDPLFDRVRSDPRYEALLARLRFPPVETA